VNQPAILGWLVSGRVGYRCRPITAWRRRKRVRSMATRNDSVAVGFLLVMRFSNCKCRASVVPVRQRARLRVGRKGAECIHAFEKADFSATVP